MEKIIIEYDKDTQTYILDNGVVIMRLSAKEISEIYKQIQLIEGDNV